MPCAQARLLINSFLHVVAPKLPSEYTHPGWPITLNGLSIENRTEDEHEFQAHVAGKTLREFVLANATAKTSVACQDINGRRVTAVLHQ